MFWNDFSALEQALAVFTAKRKVIKLDVIEEWCRRSGHLAKYELFIERVRRIDSDR
jgi:hypothetical protein